MSGNELRLRPEASSARLDTLTRDQERAFAAVIELVEAATKDLLDVEVSRRGPEFNRELGVKQVSRVVLLGGGRGSGKTTVAYTILEALDRSKDLFSKPIRDLSGPRKELQQEVANKVEGLRRHVIMLEPLRMADVPGDMNILAALLARIERLLFPRLAREDVASTGGHGHQHAAVLDLLRLQTDVAIAWDGNLRDRRGQLDPDNYAMEEMRVERVRLQLRDRFETVLRTARESLGHDRPALFLLIVDDADVDPTRLIELLDRLRLVGVSELLVLLVGDIQPMEVAFKLHFAGRFREAAPGIEPDMIGMNPNEFASLTNLIGRSALRTHLPYHQRVLLQPLRVRDAVRIVPLRRDGEEPLDLLDLLDQVPVSYPANPNEPMTLSRFVFPTDERANPWEEQYWYVGSRVLADSPRVAVDLWHTIRDAREAADPEASDVAPKPVFEGVGFVPEPHGRPLDPRLHTFVRMLAIERLDANCELWDESRSGLSAKERSQLLREGDSSTVDLVAHHTPADDNRYHTKKLPDGSEVSYWRHEGLQFSVKTRPSSRVDVGPLVLMDDLTSLENRTLAERLTRRRLDWCLRWVATPSTDGTDTARDRSPWRIPMYRTIRQIEQFGYEWNTFLEGHDQPITPDKLAYAWIAIHTRVLLGRRPARDADADPVQLDLARRLLREMVEKLPDDEEQDDWSKRVVRHWRKSVLDVLGIVGIPDPRGWVEKRV